MTTATKSRKRKTSAATSDAIRPLVAGDDVPPDFQQQLQNGNHSPASTAVINRAAKRAAAMLSPVDTESPIERPVIGSLVQTISIPLVRLIPSPYQVVESPAEDWLVESLKTEGQLVPCRVRQPNVAGKYELIAGHRRHAAAIKAGMATLRCDVIECDDLTAARQVHRDNADRHELTSLDKARGLAMLVERYEAAGQTQRQLAHDLGISQSALSNSVRLLKLPESLQKMLASGTLSVDQARWLAAWTHRPTFLAAIEDEIGNSTNGDAPLGVEEFADCVRVAKVGATRPAAASTIEHGPAFTITAANRQELEIEELACPGLITSERVFNIDLFDSLTRTAETDRKRKERQQRKAERTATASGPSSAKHVDEHDGSNLPYAIKDAWENACGRAIGAFVHGKRTKSEKEKIARLALYGYTEWELERHTVKPTAILKLTASQFLVHTFDAVRVMFTEQDGAAISCSASSHLQDLAAALGVDVAKFWRPSAPLLDSCTMAQLASFADHLRVEPCYWVKRETLIPQLLGHWERGWIPDVLRPEELRPKKPKKASKAS